MNTLMRRGLATLVAGTLLFAPTALLADEPDQEPQDEPSAAEVILDRVQHVADEAGVPVDAILSVEISFQGPGEDGEEVEFSASLQDVVDLLAGDTTLEDDPNGGWQGLPWMNAGNIMHVFVDAKVATFPSGTARDDVVTPALLGYDVAEAEITPDTPIVPGINPLLLAPAEDPTGLPPLLAMHWGGKLKSIRGSGWLTGFHSASTGLVGSSVDTAERPAEDEATFPIYLPFVDEGDSAVEDESIDFLGYALVVQGGSCTVTGHVLLGWAAVCASFGTLLGDGVSAFDGEAPVDLRADLAPLWEPAPEELAPALDAVDEAVGQIPVEDLLQQVLEATGGGPDLPEAPATLPTSSLRLR